MSLESELPLVGISEIVAAGRRFGGLIRRTPVLPLDGAVTASGGRPPELLLKSEHLQLLGSFKIRGAYNAVASLPEEVRARGVITFSSGNHGKAVAHAAALHGVKATVVMPRTAPDVKVDGVRALGATVELVPPERRDVYPYELAERTGAQVVHPFDARDVIAGQGTAGLEILEQTPALSAVLVPVSGGGLISGVAVAIKTLRPDVKVVGVEPELAGDAAASLRAGERAVWPTEDVYRTRADGLRATSLGTLPWAHIRRLVDDIVTVSEDDIDRALHCLACHGKQVVEPSGAVAPAAFLCGRYIPPTGAGPVVAVVSGGNVDPAVIASVLATPV
ncbi:threonine ammonia-lyase [Streptomyces alanosinicus]|uniref:Serine/threonine dehydratase n=1 Tax=Streptomyces alanosinicus TaxID=68171 RepID=A0A918YBB4_9ACTN|nr:threonine/serine dehydratase [Streptomyces alanosinicus]GHD97714.1 serine/threonine dehydratase [Streptomyces alanosinicus]